jgi:hypothetical protein
MEAIVLVVKQPDNRGSKVTFFHFENTIPVATQIPPRQTL